MIHPDALLVRPWELLPLLLFGFAGQGYDFYRQRKKAAKLGRKLAVINNDNISSAGLGDYFFF